MCIVIMYWNTYQPWKPHKHLISKFDLDDILNDIVRYYQILPVWYLLSVYIVDDVQVCHLFIPWKLKIITLSVSDYKLSLKYLC